MKRLRAILAGLAVLVAVALGVVQPGGEHHARPHARTGHHYFVIASSCASSEVGRNADRCWAGAHPAMLPSAYRALENR